MSNFSTRNVFSRITDIIAKIYFCKGRKRTFFATFNRGRGENRGRFRTRFYVIECKFNLLVLSGSTTGQRVLQYRLVFRADESRDGEDCVTFRSRGEVVNTVRRRMGDPSKNWVKISFKRRNRYSFLHEMYKIFDLISETR